VRVGDPYYEQEVFAVSCYLRAGFKNCGLTKGGLVALQLLPEDMPESAHPMDDNRGQLSLFQVSA
jgi:hypothetical protein